MEIIYQGTDITDLVHVRKCVVRDTAGLRCDSIKMTFDNAAGWMRWGPKEDDTIRIRHGGYDSGTMFVSHVLPEDGSYRILATALPCRARGKGFSSYYRKTLEEIMRSCAALSGMDYRLYGVDGAVGIPYIERDGEGHAAFLAKLLSMEGAALKCVNGRFTAIGYSFAQSLPAVQTMPMEPGTASYIRSGTAYRELTVMTPYASAAAQDFSVPDTHARLTTGKLPALDAIQAGRWARGELYRLNQECESVRAVSDFNPVLTAMVRVDIECSGDEGGQWLVESVEHDITSMITTAELRRCITSIR